MSAADISGKRPTRALDDELRDLWVNGPQLSPAVRRAVCGVLDSLLADGSLDDRQIQAARALRDALMSTGTTVLEQAA